MQPPESRWAFPQSLIPVSAEGRPIQSLLPLSLHMSFPHITHPLAYKSGHDLEGLPSWAFLQDLATLLYTFSVTCPCLIMWHRFLDYFCGLLPLSPPVRCTIPWARDDCILLSSGMLVFFFLHSGTCCCPSCTQALVGWASRTSGEHRKGTAAWAQRILCSLVSDGVQQQCVTSQGLLCLHVSFPSRFFFFSLLRKLFTL